MTTLSEEKFEVMETGFGEIIKSLRINNNLSQQQLADKLFVSRSSVANWESDRRVPDPVLIVRIAKFFNIDVSMLLGAVTTDSTTPEVIIVDDERFILQGTVPIVAEVMPYATITGFTKPSEAISYAEKHRIDIAFLDIELGNMNGIELCEKLTEINSTTNVVFLTSYPDYAQKAWDTAASGFLVKPVKKEDISVQLKKLRYPLKGAVYNDIMD